MRVSRGRGWRAAQALTVVCLLLALQNVYAPEDDPEMKVERYKRTFDQNEELGLNDMKTEGYEAGLAPQR